MTGAPHPMPGLWLTEVREAAVNYVRHGWPVRPAPLTFTAVSGFCDDEITDAEEALDVWTRAPYPILLGCGSAVEAIEVPGLVSRNAIHSLRVAGLLGPIIAAPFGTDYMLASAGQQRTVLEDRDLVGRQLAQGERLVLPPTAVDAPLHRWRISPTAVGWKLPNFSALQRELAKSSLPRQSDPAVLARCGQA